ncbi:MAG: helix-turn-helix domain-containing protein [Nitriliruptoraceae bacterium]
MPIEDAGSIRHGSSLGRWERAWHRPSSPLRGLVRGYHGYRRRMDVPAVHRGLPSASMVLVVSFGPTQTVATLGRPRTRVTVRSFVAGLYETPVLVDAVESHGIQVDLHPVAARRLLGVPARELLGQTVPLDAVFGAEAERLVDDLACAPDWSSRFARLDRALASRLVDGSDPDDEVTHAWERIRSTRGQIQVAALAAELGCSPRRLRDRVGEQVGLPPKRLARLARFEHAAELLSRPGPHDLTAIAHATGHYDQAHLSNEIRSFSGLTPTQLASSHLPYHGGVFDLAPE